MIYNIPPLYIANIHSMSLSVVQGLQPPDLAKTFLNKQPRQITEFLEEYGDYTLDSVRIYRSPVKPYIQFLINLATLGQFEKLKSSYNYDDVFHLYLFCSASRSRTMGTNRRDNTMARTDDLGYDTIYFYIEKNERVRAVVVPQEYGKSLAEDECRPTKWISNKGLTVQNFIRQAENSQKKNFWLYDGVNNNCQIFVMSLLRGNNLLTPGDSEFIKQDIPKLIGKKHKHAGRFITDTLGIINYALHGGLMTSSSC